MRRVARPRALTAFWVVLGLAGVARASPEHPVAYGSRSVGMAGGGVSFIDDAAATFHNPARLDAIDRFAATVAVNPFFLSSSGPFDGPGSERGGDLRVAPMPFGGFGVRVHERVVLGAATYIRSGVGSRFQEVMAYGGENVDLSLAVGELAFPLSIRIVDELSIAAAVRFGYMFMASEQPPQVTGLPVPIEQELRGFEPRPGATVGVRWDPIPELQLGLTYRSRLDIQADGTTAVDLGGPMRFPTEATFVVPHALRFGGAVRLLQERLLVALEMSVRFYGQANERFPMVVDTSDLLGAPTDASIELQWRNSVQLHVGAEYRFADIVTGAVGYTLSNSATPESHAGVMLPPPGPMHGISAGVTFHLPHLELGVAAMYTRAAADVGEVDMDSPNGTPGRYESNAGVLSLSATYRL
jgi:long-chain fatty acid transport protein